MIGCTDSTMQESELILDYSVPFEWKLAIPPLHLESSWTISLFTGSQLSRDSEGVDEMVDLFFMAAGNQLLGSNLEVGTAAEVDCDAQEFDSTNSVRNYTITSKDIPDTAWPVLIALLSQARKVGEPILRFESNGPTPVNTGTFENWASSWEDSPIPPTLPFDVEWDSPGEGRPGLLVDWDFVEPLPDEVDQFMKQIIYEWSQEVAFKGYCFEFSNQEVMFPSEGQASHIAPTAFRYQWRNYTGPGISLHSLFRFTLWLHQQGCPVKKMSLS